MTKTLNQLGEATDLETDDLLLARDTSTGDDKRITLNNSRFSRHGLTESVTLSSGVLTIPVGMSTVKLPTSVWDGSSNITISAVAFEGGVQPAVGYEFSVVAPKTTDAGSLTAGALGNEVLIEHGSGIQCEANNDADLPCYPNAADNPDQDAVQFAAPYYRLEFRVDEYDGNGDPVVSLVRLPDSVTGSNDRGNWLRWANGYQRYYEREVTFSAESSDFQYNHVMPAVFAAAPSAIPPALPSNGGSWSDTSRDDISFCGYAEGATTGSEVQFRIWPSASPAGTISDVNVAAEGEWH